MSINRLKWVAFIAPATVAAGLGVGLHIALPNFAMSPVGHTLQALFFVLGSFLFSRWVFAQVEAKEARLLSHTAQLRRLALLEERERIGMDLHDGAIQSLYAVGLSLQATARKLPPHAGGVREKLSQAAAQLSTVIQDLREYILDLRPDSLGHESLTDGLHQLADRLQHEEGLTVRRTVPDSLPSIPPATASHLLHVAGEAVSNIIRHAGATEAHLSLTATSNRIRLVIRDNGGGLSTEGTLPAERRGLRNMRARAALMGGECLITGAPGFGTEIVVTIPLDE